MQVAKSILGVMCALAPLSSTMADDFTLKMRSLRETPAGSGRLERTVTETQWPAGQTAVIVCDVWDYHHCLNAVRRLEEFAPRLNELLKEARRHGATIIHSPSDCMPAYADHPARQRAIAVPKADNLPKDVASWCSRIPSEEAAVYPIDQSDGGEDDDPAEHAEWAAKLKGLGRNPGMPWKSQSKMIEIDSERDFISDRGDEVWNVLESRGVKNVILTGVHTNMCVLGRPFGLRQMARNGKNVVLVRDMTDCMYNPQRWPYVDHFTGNDLVIAHVERFVCPTISSDQLLGGVPFRSKFDSRPKHDLLQNQIKVNRKLDRELFGRQWSLIRVPSKWSEATGGIIDNYAGAAWFRCAIRMAANPGGKSTAILQGFDPNADITAWLNGTSMRGRSDANAKATPASLVFDVPEDAVLPDDFNLLVIRVGKASGDVGLRNAPSFIANGMTTPLKGRWQFRLGDDAKWSNMPLPAKFGASPDIVFEP